MPRKQVAKKVATKKVAAKKVARKQSTKSELINENSILRNYIQNIKEQIPTLESLLSNSSQESIKLGELFEAVKRFFSVKEQHIIKLHFKYGYYDRNEIISYSKHDSLEDVFKNFFNSESHILDYDDRALSIEDYKNYNYVLYNYGNFILFKNEKEIEGYLLKETAYIKNSEISYINDKNLISLKFEFKLVFKKAIKSKTNSKTKSKTNSKKSN
jgi:hypothetical protein